MVANRACLDYGETCSELLLLKNDGRMQRENGSLIRRGKCEEGKNHSESLTFEMPSDYLPFPQNT